MNEIISSRDELINRLTEKYSWESIFQIWDDQMKKYPLSFNPFVFAEIWVHDPDNPTGRKPHPTWCPKSDMGQFQKSLQLHFYLCPGTRGKLDYYDSFYILKGQMVFLKCLWQCRADKERVAALLLNASLYERLFNRNARYQDNWPPEIDARGLYFLTNKIWYGRTTTYWHHNTTYLLVRDEYPDDTIKLADMESLIRYLADEQAKCLIEENPVVVMFKDTPDPSVRKALTDEYGLTRR